MGDVVSTVIDLLNDSYLPSNFQLAAFEATAIGRAKRV